MVLMADLNRIEGQKEFAGHILRFTQNLVEKSRSRLDPKEFRRLYIYKTYNNADYKPKTQKVGNSHSTVRQPENFKNTMMGIAMEEPKDELKMQHDLIGLTFYGVSDAYKRKFITLHSHLQFDHHPIRKLMDEFRKWFDHFIKDKQIKIKQGLQLYSEEEH